MKITDIIKEDDTAAPTAPAKLNVAILLATSPKPLVRAPRILFPEPVNELLKLLFNCATLSSNILILAVVLFNSPYIDV